MKEFNLSEERESMNNTCGYSDRSVKEFIKRLKEYFDENFEQEFIDELAGDKLNGNSVWESNKN